MLTTDRQVAPSIQEKKDFSWTYEILDPGARAEFVFRHHFQHLNSLASRIVDSETDSEDIVMNVIYKVVTSPRQPGTHEHLKRKLFVSVRNEAINYLRYRTQHRRALSHLSNLHKSQLHSSLRPHHQDREKFVLLVLQEIRRLSPQRQKILFLYYFANMNTRKIAEKLSLSVQTVLNQKARALQCLRKTSLKDIWLNLVES
jgi:RNA polymerase sigma factor (sigma-70 family)